VKKIKKIDTNDIANVDFVTGGVLVMLSRKLNEVIDVVNELIKIREKTSKGLGSWVELTLKELEKIKKEVNKC